ncbi:hypothetical protein V1477_000363 [Vespula maculifrons]|uniref:Uncharacterized protein n=1 Tax=Vespula maculifrons TaxID=7453 RepID=A0ABD2D1D9_VESMC
MQKLHENSKYAPMNESQNEWIYNQELHWQNYCIVQYKFKRKYDIKLEFDVNVVCNFKGIEMLDIFKLLKLSELKHKNCKNIEYKDAHIREPSLN